MTVRDHEGYLLLAIGDLSVSCAAVIHSLQLFVVQPLRYPVRIFRIVNPTTQAAEHMDAFYGFFLELHYRSFLLQYVCLLKDRLVELWPVK